MRLGLVGGAGAPCVALALAAAVGLTGCSGGSAPAGAPVASGSPDISPPAHDPRSGGVATLAHAVQVQQGETLLPALQRVHPALTPRRAWDLEMQRGHPGDHATPALPTDWQIRIGYLHAGGISHELVYALIDESSPCASTGASAPASGPPATYSEPSETCADWTFLSTTTGRYVAGGTQVSVS